MCPIRYSFIALNYSIVLNDESSTSAALDRARVLHGQLRKHLDIMQGTEERMFAALLGTSVMHEGETVVLLGDGDAWMW